MYYKSLETFILFSLICVCSSDVESLTPSAVTRVSGADSSLCESPILLPRQEIVPYNPGPYTGTGISP